jgi:hypothetical protein
MRGQHRWSPTLAFGHPLFLSALVLLVLNDHVLKGAGALPSLATGKLSDVAGLIVAPAVLAWVVRARTERGWMAAHASIGIVFASLELSQELAREVGLVADPYDLCTLPALAVSFVALGPKSRSLHLSRHAHVVGAIALFACAATVPNRNPAVRYPFRPGGMLQTDAYVRHMGSQELTIKVRRLKDDVRVDCGELAERPQHVLADGHFMDEQSWSLARGDAVPLWDRFHDAPERECYAVRLEAHGVNWLFTWRHGEPPLIEIPIRIETERTAEAGAIVLTEGAEPRVPAGVTFRRL